MIEPRRGDARLLLRRGDDPWRMLRLIPADAELRYFAAARGEWRANWCSSASVPDAIGVVVAGDTVVYSVGASRE